MKLIRRQILTGIDLGPRAAGVLAGAAQMARALDAELTLLHCLRPLEGGELREAACVATANLDAEVARREEQLRRLAAEVLGGARVRRVRVEVGEVVERVVALVERWSPELVVLGGQRRRVLPLCGTAERISRLCAVPVLLVPAPAPVPAARPAPAALRLLR